MTLTPESENPDPLFTIAEAANYLGVSARTIQRALHAQGPDRLTSIRLGHRTVRIRRSACDAFVATRERQGLR